MIVPIIIIASIMITSIVTITVTIVAIIAAITRIVATLLIAVATPAWLLLLLLFVKEFCCYCSAKYCYY